MTDRALHHHQLPNEGRRCLPGERRYPLKPVHSQQLIDEVRYPRQVQHNDRAVGQDPRTNRYCRGPTAISHSPPTKPMHQNAQRGEVMRVESSRHQQYVKKPDNVFLIRCLDPAHQRHGRAHQPKSRARCTFALPGCNAPISVAMPTTMRRSRSPFALSPGSSI